MDRGVWWATVYEVTRVRVRYNSVTNDQMRLGGVFRLRSHSQEVLEQVSLSDPSETRASAVTHPPHAEWLGCPSPPSAPITRRVGHGRARSISGILHPS